MNRSWTGWDKRINGFRRKFEEMEKAVDSRLDININYRRMGCSSFFYPWKSRFKFLISYSLEDEWKNFHHFLTFAFSPICTESQVKIDFNNVAKDVSSILIFRITGNSIFVFDVQIKENWFENDISKKKKTTSLRNLLHSNTCLYIAFIIAILDRYEYHVYKLNSSFERLLRRYAALWKGIFSLNKQP